MRVAGPVEAAKLAEPSWTNLSRHGPGDQPGHRGTEGAAVPRTNTRFILPTSGRCW